MLDDVASLRTQHLIETHEKVGRVESCKKRFWLC